jgi:haloalkane dehalogenase
MTAVQPRRAAALPYRDVKPEGEPTGDPVVLIHGFPESSLMWEPVMAALADAGRRAIAPDLYRLGDCGDDAPTTFEGSLRAFGDFVDELAIERVALVVHDWGGFIGLAWACDHPDRVSALVISNTGFFADGRWHGMAEAVRGEQGEQVVAAIDRAGFEGLLRTSGEFDDAAIDAYWRPFAEGRGQRATLDFYRSMDFSKLVPYQGRLAELGVPALLLWGPEDQFAPLAGARRFEREIPGARLVTVDGAGHFVFDQEPERCAREVVSFLESVPT